MGDFAAHHGVGYTAPDLPGSTIQSKSKTFRLNRKAYSLDLPPKRWMQEWTSRRTSLLVPTTPVQVQHPFYPTEVSPTSWSTSNPAGKGDWEGYQQDEELEEKRQEHKGWEKERMEEERRESKSLADVRRELKRLADERQERQRLEEEYQEEEHQRQEEERQHQEDEQLERHHRDKGRENRQEKQYGEDDRVLKAQEAAEMVRKEGQRQLEWRVGEVTEQVEGAVETEGEA